MIRSAAKGGIPLYPDEHALDDTLLEMIYLFSDCRRPGYAEKTPEAAHRFALLDSDLADEAPCAPAADLAGVRVPVDPPANRHPAFIELFGLLEEIDASALENRVAINLCAALLSLYAQQSGVSSPLSALPGLLEYAAYSIIGCAAVLGEFDECCTDERAALTSLHACAKKSGSCKAVAFSALACCAFAGRADDFDLLPDALRLVDRNAAALFVKEALNFCDPDIQASLIESALKGLSDLDKAGSAYDPSFFHRLCIAQSALQQSGE